MFYVLNFDNHQFVSCNGANSVEAKVRQLLDGGVNKNSLEIVNGYADDSRLSVDEFRAYCKEYNLIDEKRLDDFDIPTLMAELENNAWYGRSPTELYLTAGDHIIGLNGYTYEPSYESFATTSSISLDGKILYGLDSRTVEAYRCETYHTGIYERFEDALALVKDVVKDLPITTSEKEPQPWRQRAKKELPNAEYYLEKFSEEQLRELIFANRNGHDISVFADPRQTPEQLRYIYKSAEAGEDVSYYIHNLSFNPVVLNSMKGELFEHEVQEMIRGDKVQNNHGLSSVDDLITAADKKRNEQVAIMKKDKDLNLNSDLSL